MAIINPKKYEIYSYTPTKRAAELGDTPGEVEIVSEVNEKGYFDAVITCGLENYIKRGKKRLAVSINSEFVKGMALQDITPRVVDSGLHFEDLF